MNDSAANSTLALVTGFPGWLGTRLLHFLHEPHPDFPSDAEQPRFERVRCLVLPGAVDERFRRRFPAIELVEGDIRDPAAAGRLCAGAAGAVVFHLAGVIHPRRPRELFEINTMGTRHVLAAAAAARAGRVIGVSSNSPAGVSRDPSEVFDESSPDRPYMSYGHSKKLMEDALNEAHRSGAVETTVIRPCWFYGPDQPPRQSEFFSMVKNGKAPIVGGGDSRRSMSYVDNAALGILLAAARDRAAGETYWIADERPYRMNEIVDTIEEVLEQDFGMDVAHDRLRLPNAASELAMVVDAAMQKVGLYDQRVHVLSEMNKTIACSVEKAREELGYRPGVELREGMRRSIEWCLADGQRI